LTWYETSAPELLVASTGDVTSIEIRGGALAAPYATMPNARATATGAKSRFTKP
jgi:hypothetical protein